MRRMERSPTTKRSGSDPDPTPCLGIHSTSPVFSEYTSPNMANLLDEIDHINIWVLPAGAPAGSVAPSRGNVYIPADAVNFVGQNQDIVLGMLIFGEY